MPALALGGSNPILQNGRAWKHTFGLEGPPNVAGTALAGDLSTSSA